MTPERGQWTALKSRPTVVQGSYKSVLPYETLLRKGVLVQNIEKFTCVLQESETKEYYKTVKTCFATFSAVKPKYFRTSSPLPDNPKLSMVTV